MRAASPLERNTDGKTNLNSYRPTTFLKLSDGIEHDNRTRCLTERVHYLKPFPPVPAIDYLTFKLSLQLLILLGFTLRRRRLGMRGLPILT